MPLDKVIIKHLEDQDILEERIDKEIESMLASIDIVNLISSAESVLEAFVEDLQIRLKKSYYSTSSKNGIELAHSIIKDGDIKIPNSKDPNLNEALSDANIGES